MVDFETFKKIKELRNKGYTWTKLIRELGISYMTARKYYLMPEEEYKKRYEDAYLGPRNKKGDLYKNKLIKEIEHNPEISSAQLYKILEREYGKDLQLKESTLRRYVRNLREEIGIPNPKNIHIPKKYLKDEDD